MGLEIPAGTPDRGKALEAFLIVLLVATTITSAIRIASKIITKQKWWWDDYLALASWVSSSYSLILTMVEYQKDLRTSELTYYHQPLKPSAIIVLGLLITWIRLGLGLHEDFVGAQNEKDLFQGAKLFEISIIFFDICICLPKLSVLFFYARVFNISNRSFRYQLWVLGALVVGWLISACFVAIFQCDPIAKVWDPEIPGTCINQFGWYTAESATDFAIDIWILAIPIPHIWSLNTSLRRRIYLLVTFCLSYIVIIIAIGRLIATTQIIPSVKKDETWRMTPYMYWAGLEGSLSIICISVPNAISLAKALWSRGKSHRESNKSAMFERNSSENYTSTQEGETNLSESDKQKLVNEADRDVEIALGNIRVMTDIRVQ
ncbi:uncharacterized protein N7483_001927 [Penicillium malachiteum]|uniref:uncharacterized protein n=1 Tax=Penicillium malachiteum TaxID=1324776 RepID=UPI002548B277|nr:uncharacterized protein N7483_001927 [Penicillium malachiteum]KAJ5736802.1 hypothetical protein N7483_001927 [Penicillium malachiteum]